jgi:ABC-type bacteriocin/lantibiotic exporter with double-glycine peptidase domain
MSFFSQKRVGELNSRISSDITQIQDTLTSTIAEFLRQLILIVGGYYFESIKLTLLISSSISSCGGSYFGRFIRKFAKSVQDKVAESQVIVEETMQELVLLRHSPMNGTRNCSL